MGMDIYLEHARFEDSRKKVEQELYQWVERRNRENDPNKKEEYQREVERYYEQIFCAKNGYFRVNYNDYSLSYWLMYNVDEKAKADWGLEPFYSAIEGKEEPIIDSDEFRANLLETAKRWYQKALTLEDKESFLVVLDTEKSDPRKDPWAYKEIILKPEETNRYIERLKELVEFAELAVKTKSAIYVDA